MVAASVTAGGLCASIPLVVSSTREREALDQAIARGSEQLKQGRLDEAQRTFRQAHELEPENTKVLALLGLSHFRAQKFAEARPIYEELVERAPTDAAHRLNLGLVYLKLGQGDLAIDALEASRALDPSQGRAISYLGLAYARAGRYAEAYRSFLLAGQNELAAEIDQNLAPGEREAILAQIGRPMGGEAAPATPQPLQNTAPVAVPQLPPRPPQPPQPPQPQPPPQQPQQPPPQPPPPQPPQPPPPQSSAIPTTIRRDRHSAPTAPPPLGGLPIDVDPSSVGVVARQTARAITQNLVPRGKPPSVPPANLPVSDVTFPRGGDSDVAIISIGPPPRMTDSQQFVLPNRPQPVQAVPRPQEGHSMVSLAVEAAAPASPVIARTASGGRPPRPLSELATEALVRPDDSEERFEIAPGGNLVIRVVDRMLVRLEGVHATGGDLTYELATRRTRGHQTEERFDHGGATLHVVSGRGYLIATPGKYTFEAVVLDDDILYLREDLVFAFESSLRWENGNIPGLRGRLPVVQFRGDGALALRLERPFVRVKLPHQGVVFVDAERLAGWIGRVIPRAVVSPTGGPMGTMCIECTGEGVVLVEPAPPLAPGAEAPRSVFAAAPAPAQPSDAQPVIPPELANLDDDQI
jgi:Flp pilus assembly protein TadD/uncharacterized protein (AIM24 family)